MAFDATRFGAGSLTSQQDGFVIGSSTSDSQGRFLIDRLPPGTYVLQERALGYARVFVGQVPDVARASGFAITATRFYFPVEDRQSNIWLAELSKP